MASMGGFELSYAANGTKIWKHDGTRVKAADVGPDIRTLLEGQAGKKTSPGRGTVRGKKAGTAKSPAKAARSPSRAASPQKGALGSPKKSPAKSPVRSLGSASPTSPHLSSIAEAQSSFSEALEQKRFKKRHWKRNLLRMAQEVEAISAQVDLARSLNRKGVSGTTAQRSAEMEREALAKVQDLARRLRPVVANQGRKGL
jgi:hypothetical protein